ncbi:Lysosomal amino acid transporter 1 [Psilocybe cubensis]|uniref:CRA domain-containing protein n=2 Tax=Psilocybe cubensis TaxID=181762 RepID=A0A8H7Y2M5_PSICU|nr:Lysosomal amino acid transporter 1 [Psilocybe cubensis]KAH9483919.1 Lysosomal amino acid transporter 1 [Psilocybe cubensis]
MDMSYSPLSLPSQAVGRMLPDSLSEFLGFASIACWLGAQFPQVVENIRRQSCEGLALPFLANWLLGDISNLVGCIMTHQLPFQTWLATYFVFIDMMLVLQYAYYYKSPKTSSSALGHIRSASTPAAHRRLSIDRGASRYRALSVAASNVATAAALAAHHDEQANPRRSNSRFAAKINRPRGPEASNGGLDQGDELEDDPPAAMIESFYSERGRDPQSKRVSWSIERHGRASSVGQGRRSATPTVLDFGSRDPVLSPRDSGIAQSSHDPVVLDSTESLTQAPNTRSSRASRKGSNMVFLAVWALFGIGTLTSGKRGIPSDSLNGIGRVLSTQSRTGSTLSVPSNEELVYTKQGDVQHFSYVSVTIPTSFYPNSLLPREPEESPPVDEPSEQQIIGRIFAWLCTTLYLTSRLPQIWKNYARKSVEGLSMYLFVFAFLGNTFYVASILLSPRRYLPPPESTKYIKDSIPYLLGSGGTLLFDITIVSQSFCYRPRPRRHNPASHSRTVDDEEAGLLSGDALSAHLPGDSAILNRGRASRTRSSSCVFAFMSRSTAFSNPTPVQLRKLVLDYLCHSCYTRTARAFNKDSTVRHLDADGDEILEAATYGTDPRPTESEGSPSGSNEKFEALLKQVELRQAIRTEILRGRVDEAIALLDKHFPAVLRLNEPVSTSPTNNEPRLPASNIEYVSSTSTEPAHLLLNLRILAFSEACRTIPLEYPPTSESESMDTDPPIHTGISEDSEEYHEQQLALLARAQKLWAFSNTLPNPADRVTYTKELENVGGLLAYKVPEKSSMAKYLTMERREAVADQINRAILKSTGKPLISSIELLTRYTHLLWQGANQYEVKGRAGAVLPPRDKTTDSESEVRVVEKGHFYAH